MRRTAARTRTPGRTRIAGKTRIAVLAACVAIALICARTGIPAVMAAVRFAPGSPIPRDWPADKTDRMRAADRLREDAVGRPLRPPPAVPSGPRPARPTVIRRHAAGQGPEGEPGLPVSAGQAALTEGIVPLAEGGPFRPSQFLGTNLWNGEAGGRWEVVQAGGVPADRELGAASPAASAGLFVYTRSPDPASGTEPRVIGVRAPSPDPRGMFTIEAVRGRTLTLSLYGSRKRYYFDVATLRFTHPSTKFTHPSTK